MAFKIASSPHVINHNKTSLVMQKVMLCALPGIAVQCYFFGFGLIIQLLLAAITALLAEAAVLKLRKRPVLHTLKDNTALLTAVLLAVAIPPLAPWWVIVIGTLFAIVIVKQLYGGLGQNLFNPAMAAYVLLLVSFPVQMTGWLPAQGSQLNALELSALFGLIFELGQYQLEHYRLGIDGVTMATPLDALKTNLSMGLTTPEIMSKPMFAGGFGLGWFWVNAAYLLGGLALLKMQTIRWHIPASFLGSLFICSSVGFLMSPDTHGSPLFHLFSGATMFAAFFIATDPVTAATSNKGRLLFGALIGLFVYVIRQYGGYPDAVAFAVLLANLCVPFIDSYLRPRAYGHRIS